METSATLPHFIEQIQLLRVIDESGQDYLYPADCFVPIELPHVVEQIVEQAFVLAA